MAEIYATVQGHLHELKQSRDRLAAAQNATDVIQAVASVITYLGEGSRSKLNNLISEHISLKEIQRTVIKVFDEFNITQEIEQRPVAENERDEALVRLHQLADELRDATRSADTTLLRYWNDMNGLIEQTQQDMDTLDGSDLLEGDSTKFRQALLTIIEAHIASGQAGKFWI